MRITLTESGGFTGMKQTWTVDSGDLPALAQAALPRLLEAASSEPPADAVPDGRSYVFRIEDDAGETVFRHRDPLPPAVARFIEWLRERAR
jgi:hypothetical protein